MIKSVSQGLGYAPPVTLTTNGSVLPVPGNDNYAFVSKGYYGHLLLGPLVGITTLQPPCNHVFVLSCNDRLTTLPLIQKFI